MKKRYFLVIAIILISLSLSGCADILAGGILEIWDWREGFGEEFGEVRDAFKSEIGEWLTAISKYKLTEDAELVGTRTLYNDMYTGQYFAEYDCFTGKELIFGATALQPANPKALKITYSLKITSGVARLYILKSNERHISTSDRICILIADASQNGICEISLTDGDNFIVVEGEGLTGTLSITSE